MNKSFIGKKLLSLLLSVLMCLSLIPSVAFATIAEGETGSEATKGSSSNPYTLEEFGAMTRENYIAAQNSLGGTMYVNVGEYSYDTNGVLGNGVRVDSATGADKTDLNCYAANGYKGDGNDGANGKTVVFTGTSISNSVNGYTDIDKIGTSLLLAVPAYTTVKFEKIKFNGVFSFDYQLYTSPWSQLQRIEFNDCEFNGLIVGGIAATELAFVGCTFNEFKNTVSANNSNPTWIRPAYGNWTKGDNEGQGEDFKSLTKITFTNNRVTSTRPVKFERISQWDITSTVTVDGNYFDITNTDNSNKNVGMYLGFNAAANLVMGNNQKSENTAALYTVAYNKGSALPDGSTVKDLNGNDVVITDAVEWKTTNPITIKTPTDNFVAKIGDSVYATLKEAFDAVTDDTATTIKLLANCSGDGIQVKGGKNITVDFDGHTYTVDGETVGSAGTETNGFQLLAKSNITFKNGSIVSSKARILIQSYSNLTIENMTLDLSEQPLYGYTLSNNNGVTVINNSTIKAPLAKRSMAFDACGFANYGDTTVTLKGNSVIEGDVVFSNESTVNSNVTLNLEGGTIKGELSPGTGAEKVTVKKSEAVSVPAPSGYKWTTVDGVQTLVKLSYVAEVNGVKYETLQAAIDAAGKSQTVTLVSDTRENVTIAKPLTLDLNGYTLNGGTVKGKPALTVTAKGVTVKDSGTARTGTIMREDTAENSGISSYYVIDVQGVGWLTFEGGTVKNNSGSSEGKGASLVRIGDDSVDKYPGLNIKGGTFTQNNFVVIKVDRGDLFLNGGTINSANSYAIENWLRATVKGGTVNGDAASWTYSDGANSSLVINGGTINGNVTSVNYGNAENKKATVSITGGTVNGELDTRSYDPTTGKLTAIDDAEKAAIEVTGGTFTNDPTAYLVESSSITKKNGKYSVAKAYLAKVGDTQYYTMDEAFKAQTATGEDIVLLRDYEKAGTFKSGSIKRTVDLNGHTWTYTGTGINDAAFEINYSDATLTVKKGKVISNSMIGLIPAAPSMSGTITYDNSALIFENVEMISNGHSGIETNGNNTNDTVTLKNSTLNVPNGFGIYFPSSGTLNIENSAITAKTMGVQVCSGSLNISGDSVINVTGDPVEKTENDGAIQDGAAISIVNRHGYKGLDNVTITGGTFKSVKGKALKAYKWVNKEESDFDLSVIAVSGGTFSSAVPANYCAEGYVAKKNNDNTYSVKQGAYVAEVGGVKYGTLEEAYAAAESGATIKLLADCYSDRINLEDKSITLVLNGHTVTSTAAYGVLFCVKNGNTITIDGTAEGSKVVGTIMITANTYGHIVIKGGTYENAQYCPIYVNGAVSNDKSTVTITNAVITALRGNSDQDNGVAVYLAGYATSTFTNCTISAPATGIEIRAGKLDLINCNVTGGSGEIMTSANGNGTTVANAAVAVSQHNTKKAIELNITGGTYTGTAAVYQTNVQGTGSDGVKVNISSGTFNGLVKAETTNVMAISGGTFDRAVLKDYCVNEFAPVKNEDGKYEVIKLNVIKQLKLGNDLTMSYSVDSEGYTVSHVTFSIYDATLNNNQGGYTAPKTVYIKDGSFDFTGINPQRMVDTIKAVVYLVKDGKTYTYIVEDYSVKDYCLSLLNDPNYNVKWSEIISNLLVYGAEAQKYMNYRTDTLVTDYFKDCAAFKKVSHEDKMDSAIRYNEAVGGNGDITISSKLLVLDNAVNVRVYFNLKDGIDINNVKFTAAVIQGNEEKHPEEFTSFKQDANGYYFEYTGVMATELDNKIIFKSTINDAENVILNYNVNSYLVWAKNDAKLGALVKALFSYGYTCDHFAS